MNTKLWIFTLITTGLLLAFGPIPFSRAGCSQLPQYEAYDGPEGCPENDCTNDVLFPTIFCMSAAWPAECVKNHLITEFGWAVYTAECQYVSPGEWVCGEWELASETIGSWDYTVWPGVCILGG